MSEVNFGSDNRLSKNINTTSQREKTGSLVFLMRMFLWDAIVKLSCSWMFRKWRLAFALDNWKLVIFYKKWWDRVVAVHKINDHKSMMQFARDQLVDIYYAYERDGSPLTYDQIGMLLWMSGQWTSNYCKTILQKISAHKEMLVW